MLVKAAEERATVEEVSQHVWLQDATPTPTQQQQFSHATFSSPLSGDVEIQQYTSTGEENSVGDGLSSPSSLRCPLVARRGLTDDAHEWVIKQMLDGGAATSPDDVNQ